MANGPLAYIRTQGAQYYEHLFACSRSLGGPLEANKVLVNSSKGHPSTIKKIMEEAL